jgi:hypothetical protein
MNMDTYGDDHGSKSLGDTSSHSKGLNYQALKEDETHDVASSEEHVPMAQSTNKKLKWACPTTTLSPRARAKVLSTHHPLNVSFPL